MKNEENEVKVNSLREYGALNPHPGKVKDEKFLGVPFFDPKDLVQVKYEMLRQVHHEGLTVTNACRNFGLSRPTFYQAQAAFQREGLPGLLKDRPGPRSPHKMSDEIVSFMEEAVASNPKLKTKDLVHLVFERFGVSVHSRTIDRGLSRHQKKRKEHIQ